MLDINDEIFISKDESWKGEHLIRGQTYNHAGSGAATVRRMQKRMGFQRPSKAKLVEEKKTMTLKQLAKKYGVHTRTVESWLYSYAQMSVSSHFLEDDE